MTQRFLQTARHLLNQLWIRLSLAFILIVVLVIFIFNITGRWFITPDFFRRTFNNELARQGGLVDDLEAYYEAHDSWTGVESILEDTDGEKSRELITLLGTDGQTIYGGEEGIPNGPPQPPGLPIIVDNEVRGFLHTARLVDNLSQLQEPGFRIIRTALLVIAITVGVLGTLFGVVVSWTLTSPLNRLANAARAIGEGDLEQRVTLRGSTEIVAVAGAFNDMAASLAEAETLRRNMVADIAHELRTPLTVLQGNLRAILDEVYPLEKAEITRLYDQTRVLNRLIEDLHELAQADAGKLALNRQAVDISALLNAVTDSFQAASSHVTIAFEEEADSPLPPVQADPARLRQVFNNLLSNALNHTGEGGHILLTARNRDASTIEITVTDDGDGIPQEHLPHIFDRFYRAEGSRSRHNGGSGLGLAIVRALVQAHAGTITAHSDGQGHGTTFTITLPLQHSPSAK